MTRPSVHQRRENRPEPVLSVETPPIAPEGTRRRSALSEQQLREDLREQPDGAEAVEVVEALLRELDRPELGVLNVFWASKSLTIKTPAPTGSGRLSSLACATNGGDICAYLEWLTNQLEGKERAFAEGLAELARGIERLTPKA